MTPCDTSNATASVLRDPLANRGTAFTQSQRERLGLTAWLPPRVETIEDQAARAVDLVRAKASAIERYAFLSALQNENETLFFRVVTDNLHEMLPLVYTPTVGQACQEWSRRYVQPRGLYITPEHRGQIASILGRWPQRDVGVIVVTDGGRILGLGDLGANGMGIPIGKLALYTACAGVPPARCLPVLLDVGTDTPTVRDDPYYLGRRVPRLVGEAYDELIEEFVTGANETWPGVLVQFEDFNNANAFRLLARYRASHCCFNDDIQGTGAMGFAGLVTSERLTRRQLRDERILFVGAGEACLGVGTTIVSALQKQGLSDEQARARCLFVDSRGTVVASRGGLPAHKTAFARDWPSQPNLVSIIETFRPTVLFGACGRGGMFDQPVVEVLAKATPQPVIFALSNPTAKAECTAEQAYAWSGGHAIFASGSPFDPLTVDGQSRAPAQANNSHIFPGVGLGVIVSGATRVTDDMFFAAAAALAGQVTEADLAAGRIFPHQSRMREVAAAVAVAVADVAGKQDLATRPLPTDLAKAMIEAMYRPAYEPLL